VNKTGKLIMNNDGTRIQSGALAALRNILRMAIIQNVTVTSADEQAGIRSKFQTWDGAPEEKSHFEKHRIES
jgi:hypothetical protein